jgi:uncharacterized protein (TIGR03435 family)
MNFRTFLSVSDFRRESVRINLLASFLALATVVTADAQTVPTFEVSTVRQNMSGTGGNRVGISGQTLTMNNVTLRICLKVAYDLQDSQISGPDSITTDRYDIVAKASDPIQSQDQMRLMLQSLLTDRFHLKLHREQRDLSVYVLVVGKGGPKFSQSVGEGNTSLSGKGTLVARFAPMKAFAAFLSGPLQRPVVDMTGLEGKYDFKFNLMAYAPTDLEPGKDPDVGMMVVSALEPELGLRLEARKTPTSVLVIDHIEKPSEN